MATLAIHLYNPTKTGSCAIKIRLTHHGERKFFTAAVSDNKSVKNGKIINSKLAREVKLKLAEYELKMSQLDNFIESMSIEQVYGFVFEGRGIEKDVCRIDSCSDKVDFIDFYRQVIRTKKKEQKGRTYEGYQCALNNLVSYIDCGYLDIECVTKSFLMKYMEWFDEKGFGARAKEAYMTCHRAVWNLARDYFNDEDAGRLVVRFDPFRTIKYKMSKAEKDMRRVERGERCVSETAIRYLAEAPECPGSKIATMARDAFLVSFCLCGVNACDLREMKGLNKDGMIEFWRKKTRSRSGLGSHVVIPVHDYLKPLMEKYRGERMLWSFTEAYGSENTQNKALNKGLKVMAEWCVKYYSALWGTGRNETIAKLEFPKDLDLEFGFARHAFSTIARWRCRVSLDDIDECLCHATRSVAGREYVAEDFEFVADVVNKVVGYTFGV